MPVVIETQETESIALDELVQHLMDEKIDTSDHDAMIAAGPMLKKLANNRTFISDLALTELKERKNLDGFTNSYGPQTIMLVPPERDKHTFFVRANFWPSPSDHIFRASRADDFFYYSPHDHSFNFLTAGYLGPGYKSNYYEYDYAAADGHMGEKVELKFVETTSLSEGKVMLYRGFQDVHDQMPGDAMSVSLNIMENTFRGAFLDQYHFDIEGGTITKLINRVSASALLPLLAAVEDGNALDFLMEVSKTHPFGRVRCIALDAMASVAVTPEAAIDIYRLGEGCAHGQVAGHSRYRINQLESLVA